MIETILAGDIGGTNCRLDLYQIPNFDNFEIKSGERAPGTLVCSRVYQNSEFLSFKDAVKQFFAEAKIQKPPVTACLAVAGPVSNNSVNFTNRKGWSIEGDDIAHHFGIHQVRLINDFVAVGYGLLTLNEETECVALQKGKRVAGQPIACIGAGTGLGECFLTAGPGGHYVCYPTEGGHTEFAPRSDLEVGLLKYLMDKFQASHRVSVERVVSGIGLANVYEYLAREMPEKIDQKVHEEFLTAGDMRGRVVATNTNNEICRLTMEIFAGAYGSEAGVAGLKWLPYGGLYITGGLTPKNIDLIKKPSGPFLAAFKDKGRVSHMLDGVPMFAVLVEDVGQRGAHRTAYMDFVAVRETTAFQDCMRGGGDEASCSAIAHSHSGPHSAPSSGRSGPWGLVVAAAFAVAFIAIAKTR